METQTATLQERILIARRLATQLRSQLKEGYAPTDTFAKLVDRLTDEEILRSKNDYDRLKMGLIHAPKTAPAPKAVSAPKAAPEATPEPGLAFDFSETEIIPAPKPGSKLAQLFGGNKNLIFWVAVIGLAVVFLAGILSFISSVSQAVAAH